MHRAPLLAAAGLVALAVSACGKDTPATPGHEATVTATDTACTLAQSELSAGVIKFSVTNTGAKITEFYVFQGDKALGEVENISPQTTRNLSVELGAGTYQGVCKPGMVGEGIRSTFTVSGAASALSSDEKLAVAVTTYKEYVHSQANLLAPKTKEFTDAIRAGDAARAKALYPVARSYYEAIEPVAESFGDLDSAIDAREGDVDPGQDWTGFHALEQHLWVTGDIRAADAVASAAAGMGRARALADKLDADVAKLVSQTRTVELKPLEIANGAKELLDEVATSKITGEEDRYSHTDLWDFAANVAGVQAAVDALRPALTARDAALMSEVDERYEAVEDLLNTQKVGDGYKVYTDLTPAETKALADAISALAEPVSKVAAAITAK